MQIRQSPGISISQVDTTPNFALGTVVTVPVTYTDLAVNGTTSQTTKGHSTLRYVKAGAALTANEVCLIDRNFVAGELAGTDTVVKHANITGKHCACGVPQVDIASGSYGWVVISELVKVKVLADCAAFVPLYTSATDNVLDDASSSQTQLQGVHLLSVASGTAQAKVGRILGELRVGA